MMGDLDHVELIFGKVWKATLGVEIRFDNLKFGSNLDNFLAGTSTYVIKFKTLMLGRYILDVLAGGHVACYMLDVLESGHVWLHGEGIL